jgi:predicted transcriptional regulator
MKEAVIRQKPTKSELAILQIAWEMGEVTVRQVYERLLEQREIGYTTVLKLMQLMTEKGLLIRSELGKAHVYRTAETPSLARQSLVEDFIERAFSGSAADLVMHALNSRRASTAELAQIRALIDRLEDSHE